jgi:hypothetical protein
MISGMCAADFAALAALGPMRLEDRAVRKSTMSTVGNPKLV